MNSYWKATPVRFVKDRNRSGSICIYDVSLEGCHCISSVERRPLMHDKARRRMTSSFERLLPCVNAKSKAIHTKIESAMTIDRVRELARSSMSSGILDNGRYIKRMQNTFFFLLRIAYSDFPITSQLIIP